MPPSEDVGAEPRLVGLADGRLAGTAGHLERRDDAPFQATRPPAASSGRAGVRARTRA